MYGKLFRHLVATHTTCSKEIIFDNRFHQLLTWLQDSRPGNLTIGVKFCVDSELQVKKSQILYPEAKNRKTESKDFVILLCFVVGFLSGY